MAGFSRGQGVPRTALGPPPARASTNPNKMLYRLITVACTGLLAQPS